MCRLFYAITFCSLWVLTGCGSSTSPPGTELAVVQPAQSQFPTSPNLRIGSISTRPKHEIEKYRPLADYLTRQLNPHGVGGCNVVVADSMEEMASLMKNGEIDIYIDSPYPVVRVSELCGATPFLRRWKKSQETYHGVVFARKESGIACVEDLKGYVIAFDEEFSTAGYILPKNTLLQLGLTLMAVDDASCKVPSDRVGYIFSRDDENTLFWVSRGKVAAGATNNIAFEQLTRDQPNEFVVLVETVPVPRHVVCHRVDLDPALVDTLKDILLKMANNELGRKVLDEFEKTTKFDEFPMGADVALAPIHKDKIKN